MADYHQTVTEKATPIGEFTNWCARTQNPAMKNPLADRRRENLRRLIEIHYANNQSSLARAYNPDSPKPNYISDLLRGKKSFAEKAARNIESRIGLVPGQLDIENSKLIFLEGFGNRIRDELMEAIEGLSPKEQQEALASIQKIRNKRRQTG